MKIILLILMALPSFAYAKGSMHLIGFNDHLSNKIFVLESFGVKVVKTLPQINLVYAKVTPEQKTKISQLSQLKFIQKEQIIHLSKVIPNDEKFDKQKLAMINLPQAWETTKGSKSIIVAVTDTGAPRKHKEYQGLTWINRNEVPGNGIDDDQNGYIDDYDGWSFARKTNNNADVHGHGSHVTGVIGANSDNQEGVAGINWKVTIMNLACFSRKGTAKDINLTEAIIYATDHGARIINASWGSSSKSKATAEAIRYAGDKGVLFVAAAGNDSKNNDTKKSYPANLTLPNVISVGSIVSRNSRSRFSNFGQYSVDFGAPGSFVLSLSRSKGYKYMSGTSMASPHAAGVAALILSVDPSLSVVDLKNAMLNAVDRSDRFARYFATSGILNAQKAVEQLSMGPQIWPSQINLKVGHPHKMTAYRFDTARWQSSAPNIAKVDHNGLVTPLQEGEFHITATDKKI